MILSLMSFGDFHWLHNPLELKIENRIISHTRIYPDKGEKLYSNGKTCRVITGKGELLGSDCGEKFHRLYEVFSKGESRVLSLPLFGPVYAKFIALEVLGDTTPDILTYSFEFVEDDSFSHDEIRESCEVKTGETLFDIAYREGVELNTLVRLNPQIKRPDELSKGERVRLC